jgi:hypothetical protein
MHSRPLIYWETAALDRRPPVRVLTRRPMILPQFDGEPGHTPAKTEITLSASVLDGLDPADIVVIGPVPDDPSFDI